MSLNQTQKSLAIALLRQIDEALLPRFHWHCQSRPRLGKFTIFEVVKVGFSIVTRTAIGLYESPFN